MEAQEYVRYRASVTSLAKGGWAVDATVEVQASITQNTLESTGEVVLGLLRPFVDKLREEYPPQVSEKP